MAILESRFRLTGETSVLDLGGTSFNWQFVTAKPKIVMLNLDARSKGPLDTNWVIADGKHLPFAQATFDIVYSNSVIEHVGSQENQVRLAEECRRVGRRYYVQTPNKCFPIEPHLLTPFFHWLPRGMQQRLIRRFTVWGWFARPSREYCDNFLAQTKLLSEADLRCLFPDAEIWKERFLGLTKSIIAVRIDPLQ
jgi:ubiquinone/menaquinone biosynthesis C-methylase UbiE